ncbi:hypothetical protein EFY79_18295 [Hanamia caeni]|uniref:HIRAN domain-containing protein n=1 Tax=Hanamia caeni TaxID=2294116 RepID=A0A3M9N8N3_9BACT|nr:HIRAN domain-containing protein [Hanamia caeni]RNI33573.1 hypothetical protein EFY79_18295 [Hanamia caeni]
MNRSGFLKRLVGIPGLGFLSIAQVAASQKVFLLQSFVAGFRFYKGMELLPHMQEQDIVELRRQPDNEHDEFAVAVYWQQEMIGYLPAASSEVSARLMDAKALPLVGIITHLQRDAQPWENVAVAVYFLKDGSVPEYLTKVEPPVYTTIHKKDKTKKNTIPDVLEYEERIIALDGIADEAAKAYFTKYYQKHRMQIGGRTYVKVPDDGIYTYMYEVESLDWITADDGKKYLEFVFN